MIKLTKNETAVYAAIETATTVDDITVIADMKKAAVLGVLASMVKKGAAQSAMDGEVKMYSRTDAEVELHVEQVVEQPQNTPTVAVESKDEDLCAPIPNNPRTSVINAAASTTGISPVQPNSLDVHSANGATTNCQPIQQRCKHAVLSIAQPHTPVDSTDMP